MHEHIRHHEQVTEASSDRNFGLVFTVFFLIVAFLPLLHGQSLRIWAVGVSLIFGGISIAIPTILAPLNRIWTKFGLLLHRIVSPIALGILFFLVVTPTAVLMRLFGKDPLRLVIDKTVPSYWIERAPPGPEAESLKNQF